MGKPIKVLSIRQPHADDIIFADKFAENRTWNTNYRGELFIHASRWDGKPFETDGNGTVGAIIGNCQLVDCVPVEDLDEVRDALFERMKRRTKPKPVADRLQPLLDLAIAEQWEAASFNRHATGPICFILTDRQPLAEPVPALGKLNVWTFELAERYS